MTATEIFSSLRKRRSPSLEAVLAPVVLTDVTLIQSLASLSCELVSCFSGKSLFFQRVNFRSLVRKIEVLMVLLESLRESSSCIELSSTAIVCLNELYLFLHRSKILLEYCVQSSKLWLLLQNQTVSGYFDDLNKEFFTLLDVFPLNDFELSDDVREQIVLIHKQAERARLYIDKKDEELRLRLFSFFSEFENGRIPNEGELRLFFVGSLGISDAKSCNSEIEFLEEQIVNNDRDVEPAVSVINGFVAIARYACFLLFGFVGNEVKMQIDNDAAGEIAEASIRIPSDFCCPITLELMQDPVIISTGQTYDRSSISRWIMEGNTSCPKTGQSLMNTGLVPNRALRNLIVQWSAAHGIPYDPPETVDSFAQACAAALPTKAEKEANKAIVTLLIQQLASGSEGAKTVAVREIRLMSKTGNESRAFITEAGAIPQLCKLLSSSNPVAQENCVTAMLNLSIYDKNKRLIMDEEGCLTSIVDVLRIGLTTEARENAAATLFSLSAVHEYKKRIADEEGAIEALGGLLHQGTSRGMKDAVTVLFNLCTHTETCARMVEAGVISALVGALSNEVIAEEAACLLALIVRQPIGAEAVGRDEMSVTGLMEMMQYGTPRGKENAVAALLELCRSGGAATTEKVFKAPVMASLLHNLVFTGTKRARRKAVSLARVFERCKKNNASHLGGLGVGHPFAGNSTVNTNRETNFISDISVPMSSSVPVS